MSENPNFVFVEAGGVPCPVLTLSAQFAQNSAGAAFITAVTGKKIRIISLTAFSIGAANSGGLTSVAGGPTICAFSVPANTSDSPNVIYPPSKSGWGDSGVSAAAPVNTGTGGAVQISVTYIYYTPVTA